MFRNLGNDKFEDASPDAGPDFAKEAPHRGVAFGDIDHDGHLDRMVPVLNRPVKLFHTISRDNNYWILLKPVGSRSNRMGIGAQIRIMTDDGQSQWSESTTAVGCASSSDCRVHFGLGSNRHIKEIEIHWPSGIKQVLPNVDVDRIMSIQEPPR